jgi:hypothetical protein
MSYARAKRILMKWERYHKRFPQSGAWPIGPERYHTGHLTAHSRAAYAGRYAPIGIRDPYRLSR